MSVIKKIVFHSVMLYSSTAFALDFGWNELPNTHMRDVCPPDTADYAFSKKCKNVIVTWSGGIYDSTRNRLIIWGGGHNDYYGNEVYALNLNNTTFERLTNPSGGFEVRGDCVDALPDGNPSSRHSYGGLAYLAHEDKMFAYGGSRGCGTGNFGRDTWTFDFKTNKWTQMNAPGPNPGITVVASAYDAKTKKVFVRNPYGFFAYSYDSDTWEQFTKNDNISSFGKASATIDPVRRKFVIVAPPGVFTIDLDGSGNYKAIPLSTTGPQTIINDGRSPGLAYDSIRDRIVAWDGSDAGSTPDTVYVLNLDTAEWIAVADPGNGPQGGNTRGTFGRWRYVPKLDAFVVVNNVDENAFLFRLEPESSTQPDTVAPAAPTQLNVE